MAVCEAAYLTSSRVASEKFVDTQTDTQMPYNEQYAIQFRLETFNTFNHPSWGAPSGNILAGAPFAGASSTAAHSGFGVITSTAIPMRQVQVALKYQF